jgi:DNA-binding transcriptional LysR family regulator
MQSLEERGVPQKEHTSTGPNPLLSDWQSVRIFLELTRRGSFRATAEYFCCSVNALRRRIDDMERSLGVPLLTRHVGGVQVTAEGGPILAAAQEMELASFGLLRARDQVTHTLSGEVRVAVTEGLGTFWLAPRLAEFQRAYPGLLIDLHCAMRSADVLRLEADASIQLARPTAPDLKQVKLGRLHVMPFAARSYIDTYGLPTSREELLQHRIVLHVSDQTAAKKIYGEWFPEKPK